MKFTNKEIIFDDGDFSISIGMYESNKPCLAMRWNGHNGSQGFPTSFGKPTWLVVPNLFAQSILETIEESKKREILKFLKIE